MTNDETILAERATAGDETAFEVLVRRHTEAVWRLAFGILRDRNAAEDAAQDTFLKVHRALGSFRGEASFRTWVLRIAHRTCLDRLRAEPPAVVSLDEARARRARGVDEATRLALEIAVADLPDDEREAFLLVDALGLSREEAASTLGVPASTLKSRLARARARLVEAVLGEETPRRRANRRRTQR